MTVENTPLAPGMAQCSITGKIVPEDEIVTLHGQRVCAEGKAILLQRLQSGEAMPGEMVHPTVLRRFGCIFLDAIIIMVPFAILSSVVAGPAAGAVTAALITLISTAVQVVYFGQLHGTRGQTVGKMAGKTKVVNLDGSPISLRTGYVRALAYIGPNFLTGIATFFAVPIRSGGYVAQSSIVLGVSVLVGIYGIVNVICALVDTNLQRALHDRIAGTREIQLD